MQIVISCNELWYTWSGQLCYITCLSCVWDVLDWTLVGKESVMISIYGQNWLLYSIFRKKRGDAKWRSCLKHNKMVNTNIKFNVHIKIYHFNSETVRMGYEKHSFQNIRYQLSSNDRRNMNPWLQWVITALAHSNSIDMT